MLVGVGATAYIYAVSLIPNCGSPPSGGSYTSHGNMGITNVNSRPFYYLNVTFTAVDQSASLAGVTFQTTAFTDPTFPTLKGTACVTNPSSPYNASIKATFNDRTSQTLTIAYGGNPPASSDTASFSNNHDPTAGVEWLQGANCLQLQGGCFITLLVSET
jgi:hypothetical protein